MTFLTTFKVLNSAYFEEGWEEFWELLVMGIISGMLSLYLESEIYVYILQLCCAIGFLIICLSLTAGHGGNAVQILHPEGWLSYFNPM